MYIRIGVHKNWCTVYISSQNWVCGVNRELGIPVSVHWFAEWGRTLGSGRQELRIYRWVNWNPTWLPTQRTHFELSVECNFYLHTSILKLLSSHCCCQNITNPLNHFHTEHSPSAEEGPSMQNVFGPKIYILTFTFFVFLLLVFMFKFCCGIFFSP